MRLLEIVNCFINGAAHQFYKQHSYPMVDEDLGMAFDEAERYAHAFSYSTSEEAHAAGHHYIANGIMIYADPRDQQANVRDFMESNDCREGDTFDATFEYMEACIEIVILCPESQGFALQLSPDGTYTTHPVGG